MVTEHCGQAADVIYNKRRESHNLHLVDPFDNLLITAKDIPGINTSGKQILKKYTFTHNEKSHYCK